MNFCFRACSRARVRSVIRPQHRANTTSAVNDFVAKSHVMHRALRSEPQSIVSGSGISFVLANGKTLIDASGGPAVSCLGHHRPEVAKAVADQINKIGYVYSVGYTSDPAEELATMLLKDKPGGLSRAMFFNSGSEATDAAVKLATQYWKEKGELQRRNVISRAQSYHGNTIGALCVSGHESRRAMYSDWMSNNVSFVDPCYAYRAKPDGQSDEEYLTHLIKQLDDEFHRLGPETVSAFFAETISGTTLGCLPALPGYFKAVRELCDKYGALLILDEIICGMGKTGAMHAWQQEEGFRGPDLQTIGKTLGGGFVPLSAVLVHEKVFDALAVGTGALSHGHTFQAHPTACAAAIEVQKIIGQENLLENCQKMGAVLGERMKAEILPLPLVGDVRGRGLYWAAEFVMDKEAKTPFPLSDNFSTKVVAAAAELGLNILGNLGKTGLIDVEHVMITPPYIITEDEVVKVVGLLKKAIQRASEPYL
ncbi:Aminotransferase class-3 [Macrophomina phaseolina MS6]|uniref:Aminotransferase class-3 n=2 Tax=Macrophomina phaseolina TaxID=35725 RepID=K2SXH9_MACPH|nr:Aminotransferase class-3 [Macrophomina phaseolina MS6]KAH7058703.1 pyridoxal phosphate-dependent transferase [Macrophomina phaseolina]